MSRAKIIHESHPTASYVHPFKYWTLCGRASRFGSRAIENRPVSCKSCLKIIETLCPTCLGTGVKEKPKGAEGDE